MTTLELALVLVIVFCLGLIVAVSAGRYDARQKAKAALAQPAAFSGEPREYPAEKAIAPKAAAAPVPVFAAPAPGTAPAALDPKVAERLRKAGFRTDGFSPVSTTVRSK